MKNPGSDSQITRVQDILGRARFLEELSRDEIQELPADMLTQWRERAAGGDSLRFARFQNWFYSSKPPASPPSAEILRVLLRLLSPWSITRVPQSAKESPFGHLISPLAEGAWEELGPAYPAPPVRQALDIQIREALLKIWQNPLLEEFNKIRPASGVLMARLLGEGARKRRAHYIAFADAHSKIGWLPLFELYPAAARATAEIILNWTTASRHFLEALQSDQARISEVFGAAGEIVEMEAKLSDPHGGFRSVFRLRYENGIKVLYKPRSCAIDAAWASLLSEVEAWDENLLPMRAPITLCREGYGWVEHVESVPCETPDERTRLRRKLGQLCALLYILGAKDFHYENWIFARDNPVPIDMEALLHPDVRSEWTPEFDPILVPLYGSVSDSCLLPRWIFVSGAGVYDLSPLNDKVGLQDESLTRWVAVNSDSMAHLVEHVKKTVPEAVPDDGFSPSSQEEVQQGFRQITAVFRAQDRAVAQGILERFRTLDVRLVARQTVAYYDVLDSSLSAQALRSGVHRSIVLHHLARDYTLFPSPPPMWPLFFSETKALSQLDIPLIRGTTDSDAVIGCDGASIPGVLVRPPIDQAEDLLKSLDDFRWRQQELVVQASFELARYEAGGKERDTTTEVVKAPRGANLEDGARRIAYWLRETAIPLQDGAPSWLTPNQLGSSVRFSISTPNSWGIYEGQTGISLFLAAAGRCLGDGALTELALESVRPLREHVRRKMETGAAPSMFVRLGLGDGVGSTVYALVTLAALTGHSDLLDEAEHVAAGLPEAAIRGDLQLDILSGVAGELIALLALYRSRPAERTLQLAKLCARHLLDSQGRTPDRSGWDCPLVGMLTGMSHGAAGICLALARLHSVAPDPELAAAIQNGLAFERSHFRASEKNWQDLRPNDAGEIVERFMTAWCHGAPGICLGRLAMPEPFQSDESQAEVAAAIENILNVDESPVDHYCCGEAGKIEALWSAGLARRNRDWQQAAWDRAVSLAALEVEGLRPYRLLTGGSCAIRRPALFTGMAGIGYQFLRMEHPGKLPSLLSFETKTD